MWNYCDEQEETTIINGNTLTIKNFREYTKNWSLEKAWVKIFLNTLDILYEKKSYVAMSDIMRMMILYFMGGMYLDIKIKIDSPDCDFFTSPSMEKNILYMMPTESGRLENAGLLAHKMCSAIDVIMQKTAQEKIPTDERLKEMPVNYSVFHLEISLEENGDVVEIQPLTRMYSQAHKTLHETYSVWPVIQNSGPSEICTMDNLKIKLVNPRTVNSWAFSDNIPFEFKK